MATAYLGYVRLALSDPFWDSWPGRAFFRVLDDVTLEAVLRDIFSLVPALDTGDDNDRVAADASPRPVVTAPADAFAAVMHTPLCRAALLARANFGDSNFGRDDETGVSGSEP